MDALESEALAQHSVSEIRDLVIRGQVKCEEVTRAFLSRIERIEHEVGAWAFLDPELSLAEARSRDAAPGNGPTAGGSHRRQRRLRHEGHAYGIWIIDLRWPPARA